MAMRCEDCGLARAAWLNAVLCEDSDGVVYVDVYCDKCLADREANGQQCARQSLKPGEYLAARTASPSFGG